MTTQYQHMLQRWPVSERVIVREDGGEEKATSAAKSEIGFRFGGSPSGAK